ncbi:hypothetical protein HHA02_33490 [Cobetia marina]|nr:hypothetical protein HHA02_33490 [Cobetia marina]
MPMLISVIIPHKNSPKKLDRLLTSIPDQKNIEIIIVDDNSDACLRPGRTDFINSNVIHLDNINDNNAGTARNLGLQNACGEWIIFADADDKFIKENFLLLLNTLYEEKKSDIIFYKCLALKEETEEASNRASLYSNLLYVGADEYKNIAYNWLVPWGKAIRKDIIIKNNIKFDSRMASNDVMFSTRLAYHINNISIIHTPLYICYESLSSLTATLNPAKAYDRLGALVDRNEFLMKNQVKIKKDYGFTYFFKSKPLIYNMKKYKLYIKWMIVTIQVMSESILNK